MKKYAGHTVEQFIDQMMTVESYETVAKAYERVFGKTETDNADPNRPEIGMIKQLVEFLDKDRSGFLSRAEIKQLFSDISGVDVDDIDDEHPEVVAYSNLTTGELSHKLWCDASREKVEKFHAACNLVWTRPENLMHPYPDITKIRKIVAELDLEDDHPTKNEETIRSFLSRLHRCAPESISSTDESIVMFSTLPKHQIIDKMHRSMSKGMIDAYYHSLFPSLLNPQADREKVHQIVNALDVNSDGDLSTTEVKVLFSKLLKVDVDEIPDTDEMVMAFANLPVEDLIDKMLDECPRDTIEKYYYALFPPTMMLNPRPEKEQVKKIVQFLDEDGDGNITLEETKVLLSKMLNIPVEEIDEENQELLEFSGLSTEMLINKLYTTIARDTVQKYYDALFPPPPSMFDQKPDRAKVEKLVDHLDDDGDGNLGLDEIKFLFSKLTGNPVDEISDDDPQVVEFVGLTTQQFVDKLMMCVDKATVEKYYLVLFPPSTLFNQPPDYDKIVKIVATIDSSGDGCMDVAEVKVLLAKLLYMKPEEIPDDHPEVVSHAGLSTEELVQKLVDTVPKDTVERLYNDLFPPDSLLNPRPDPEKVKKIIDVLDTSNDGVLDDSEIKVLLGRISGVPPSQITSETHPELDNFVGLTKENLCVKICQVCNKAAVERYYTAMFPPASLLNPRPDKDKVTKVVQALDLDGDGSMTADEVKVLFSKILQVDESTIPDDHEEIISFVGLTQGEMIDKLVATMPAETVNAFYLQFFPTNSMQDETLAKRVMRIVKRLDVNEDGQLTTDEVKVFFAKLLGIPMQAMDDHPDVAEFIGMKAEHMAERLIQKFPNNILTRYFFDLFPEEKDVPGAIRNTEAAIIEELIGLDEELRDLKQMEGDPLEVQLAMEAHAAKRAVAQARKAYADKKAACGL